MSESTQAAVPTDVPRFEVPSDTPTAPIDPSQASLQRAQRGYQTGWTSPWDDDAIRPEPVEPAEPAEPAWQAPVAAAAAPRRGFRLFGRRARDPQPEDDTAGPQAAPTRSAATGEQPEIGPAQASGPRRMAADSGSQQPQMLDDGPGVGQSGAAG